MMQTWSAREELALVEAVMRFGIGNWIDVAEQSQVLREKNRTPSDCEEHYMALYWSHDGKTGFNRT